jgi:hypothetical protein
MLCTGRVISGFGVGIASAVVPVYMAEIAPKETRGRIVTLQQWAITWGILIQVRTVTEASLYHVLLTPSSTTFNTAHLSSVVVPRRPAKALPLSVFRGASRQFPPSFWCLACDSSLTPLVGSELRIVGTRRTFPWISSDNPVTDSWTASRSSPTSTPVVTSTPPRSWLNTKRSKPHLPSNAKYKRPPGKPSEPHECFDESFSACLSRCGRNCAE